MRLAAGCDRVFDVLDCPEDSTRRRFEICGRRITRRLAAMPTAAVAAKAPIDVLFPVP